MAAGRLQLYIGGANKKGAMNGGIPPFMTPWIISDPLGCVFFLEI